MSFTEEELEKAWDEEVGFGKWGLYSAPVRDGFVKLANTLIAKRDGEPIDAENIRKGDLVMGTIARQCSEFSRGGVVKGMAYHSVTGKPHVAGWPIDTLDNLRLLHRPAPQLPTKAPAVIKATEVRGVKGEWWLTLDHEDKWRSTEAINGWFVHLPMYITAWKPADFVVREEES